MVPAVGFVFACLASVGHGRRMSRLLSSQSLDDFKHLLRLSPESESLAQTLLALSPAATQRLLAFRDNSLVGSPDVESRRYTGVMSDETKPSSLGRRVVTSSAGVAAFSSLTPTSPLSPSAAYAKELSSGSGSIVNKDPESLLRYGLPNQPKDMIYLQQQLEDAERNLGKNLPIQAVSNLKSAQGKLQSQQILKAIPSGSMPNAEKLLNGIGGDIESALSESRKVGEEKVRDALKKVTAIEELIASTYSQPVPPEEFTKNIPWLKGRATITMEIKRPGGKFDVANTLYDKVDLTMVVDGYTAPITAGNFVDLVQRGFYNGFKIQRSDGFVVQTGDPADENAPKPQKENGFIPAGSDKVRRIPLEVFVKGDKTPMYDASFDDDGRGGYAAALPFNAYGALGMAITESQYDSGSSQFFWLLFDSDLTPGGKNLLDGRYACFGYTVGNSDLLAGVAEGDVITKATVTSGLDNLVQPSS